MLNRPRPVLPEGCVSDLQLDNLRAGELSGELQREIEAHVATCERCRERKRTLDMAVDEIGSRLPPFAPRAAQTASTRRPSRLARFVRRGAPAIALAAGVLFALLPWVAQERERERATRGKGGPGLIVYIKRGESVSTWTPHEGVRPGDALRFVAQPHGFGYVAILSRSGEETSVYYPQAERAAALDPNASEVALEGAIELDQSPRDEQLFAVFCRAQFAIRPLTRELGAQGRIAPRADCSVVSLRLWKESPP